MYLLLAGHSALRWIIVAVMVYSIISAYFGWKMQSSFSSKYSFIINGLALIALAQLLVGTFVYLQSPIPESFQTGWPGSMHNRPLRFFAIEHSSSMFIALAILIAGKFWISRCSTDHRKFKIMGVYCGAAMLIIMLATPWQFSPFVSRPHLRVPDLIEKITFLN